MRLIGPNQMEMAWAEERRLRRAQALAPLELVSYRVESVSNASTLRRLVRIWHCNTDADFIPTCAQYVADDGVWVELMCQHGGDDRVFQLCQEIAERNRVRVPGRRTQTRDFSELPTGFGLEQLLSLGALEPGDGFDGVEAIVEMCR